MLKKQFLYLIIFLLVPTVVLGAVLIISTKDVSDDNPVDQFMVGNAFYLKGDYESALVHFERAAELDPDYEAALNNLAFCYNRLGRFEDAAGALARLAEIDPKNPSYHYDLGVNIMLSIQQDNKGTIEEVEAALESFRQAESLNPGFEHAKENINFTEDLARQYYGQQ
ncbi:tetratricopeptide repeat protein [Candidatus Woesearchaeota archaeon]|nr:tetratricopeptide repeat protein [Candidatus Woesearchaeota archaeon]